MATVAPEVAWSIIRKQANYIKVEPNTKRAFSRDALNVNGVHSYKFANVQPTLSVTTKNGRAVGISTTKATNKPAQGVHTVKLSNGSVRSTNLINKTAFKNVGRPDLRDLALTRFAKLHKASSSTKIKAVKQGRK